MMQRTSGPEIGRQRGLHRCDAAPPDLADLLVGQRVIKGVETQSVGKAAPPSAELGSSEDVEEPDVDEEIAACLAQALLYGRRRHGIVDDEGEIDVGGRESADGEEDRRTARRGEQALEVDGEPPDAS